MKPGRLPRCAHCGSAFRKKRRRQRFCSRLCGRRPIVGCEISGCKRKHAALGLCALHYTRRGNGGDMDAPPRVVARKGQSRACWAPECGRTATARGLCERHYRAALRAISPPCRIDSCGRKGLGLADGLCGTHHERRRLGLDLQVPIKEMRPLRGCSVDGCKGRHKAKGLCGTHYGKKLNWRRNRPGECIRCRRDVSPGAKMCADHLARERAKKARLATERRQRGECIVCGAEANGARKCSGCREKFRSYAANRRASLDPSYVKRTLVLGGWPKGAPIPDDILRLKRWTLAAQRASGWSRIKPRTETK